MPLPGISAADAIQGIDRPVVMLSKEYASGHRTGVHRHPRTQFLFAQYGTMRAQTELGAWIVPPRYGLLIPSYVEHQVEMFGAVALKSAYFEPHQLPSQRHRSCNVIAVSTLLSACIERLSMEPAKYDDDGIAGKLAAIIIAEIDSTPPSAMALPFPISPKLAELAQAILRDPSDARTIDDWSQLLAMSRRSFTRQFRYETGMPFDQWRQRRRFQAATEMMASGRPMPQIATNVGYGSVTALKTMMAKFYTLGE